MKKGFFIFFLGILIVSCNKNSCSVKNTQVNTYTFQDSIYSPILSAWANQSYDLAISFCTKSPENLRIKFLNTVSDDILADRKVDDKSFSIPFQELNVEGWKSVSGNGSLTENTVHISYTMENFELQEFTGVGFGELK